MVDNKTVDMSIDMADAVVALRRAVTRAAQATFAGDINFRQAAILREIRASGPMPQVELARATAIDPSLLIRLLDDLERRGLVRRQRSDVDRRKVTADLTHEGRDALGSVDAAYRGLGRSAAGDLSASEQALFISLAARVVRSLSENVNAPCAREDRCELC